MGINNEFAGMVILIVDDEPDNIGVAKGILTFLGAKVYTAKNGIEGLNTLRGITPDLILLDLSMPQMDGWEMLKEVRKQPDKATLPVIALTAHALPGDREQVQNAGFDYYIAKPFRLGSFLSEVRRVIKKQDIAPARQVGLGLDHGGQVKSFGQSSEGGHKSAV